MSLDGKLAAKTGDSRWISGEASRAVVHRLRGRVDAILIGRGTAAADDPQLTARPPGPRTALRIILDSRASLALDSQLVRTSLEAPVLVAAGPQAPDESCQKLEAAGVEVWRSAADDRDARLSELLQELGRRQMTNVLVEGGAHVFGSLLDLRLIDEVHAFVAPRILGGLAPSPVAGRGAGVIGEALRLAAPTIEPCGEDAYICGRIGGGDAPGVDD
jgi:diaminohydroxyphosphoribosylaminopyrimidine deaminase/5-amino-6-(5-phosphoribosylamino)uracil reductase